MEPESYVYEPIQYGEFRLLRILSSSNEHDLHLSLDRYFRISHHHSPGYEALSYCWGDVRKTKQITIDGKRFEITESLHEALVQIFRDRGRTEAEARPRTWRGELDLNCPTWADAICINQQDEQEKTEQVHQMWSIYQSAARVLVWLGPEARHTGAAYSAMIESLECGRAEVDEELRAWRMSGGERELCSEYMKHPKLSKAALSGLLDLTTRSYFRRAWVIQEYSQAQSIKIMCGKFSFGPIQLYHATSIPACRRELSQCAYVHLHGPWSSTSRYPNIGLERVVDMFFDSLCSDPRDKVFAMIGHPAVIGTAFWVDRPQLNIHYSMKTHEILLCLLEWYSLRVNSLGWTAERLSLMLFHMCETLVLPRFHRWVAHFPDLNIEHLPAYIELENGRRVACDGWILSEITRSWHGTKLTGAEELEILNAGDVVPGTRE